MVMPAPEATMTPKSERQILEDRDSKFFWLSGPPPVDAAERSSQTTTTSQDSKAPELRRRDFSIRFAGGKEKGFLTSRFEHRASRIEVPSFLAFGCPPRRHGWTRLGKLVRLEPGRGPGTYFERIFVGPRKEEEEKERE